MYVPKYIHIYVQLTKWLYSQTPVNLHDVRKSTFSQTCTVASPWEAPSPSRTDNHPPAFDGASLCHVSACVCVPEQLSVGQI